MKRPTQIYGCKKDRGCFVGEAKRESLDIPGSLLVIHHSGKELQIARIGVLSYIHHVDVSLPVERTALV
jgi:hypothetical protein